MFCGENKENKGEVKAAMAESTVIFSSAESKRSILASEIAIVC